MPGIIFVDVVVYEWNVCSEMGPLCSRFHDNEVRVKALSFTERIAFFFNMTCVGIKLPFPLPGCQQRSVSRDERGYKGGTNEGRLYWLAGCREVCCDLCRTTEH